MIPTRQMVRKLLLLGVFVIVMGGFLTSIDFLAAKGFEMAELLASQPEVSRWVAYCLFAYGSTACFVMMTSRTRFALGRAVHCYLAFGLAMSAVYHLINVSAHGCFQFPSENASPASIVDFVYFSFVTVTTVGYGDIVPKHTFVRGLVLLQVLFGIGLLVKLGQHKTPKAVPE